MSDDHLLSSHRPPPPRQPQPGEELWRVVKGTETRHAELRDNGRLGVELQVFVNGEFAHGQRYESRPIALQEAARIRGALEGVGFE